MVKCTMTRGAFLTDWTKSVSLFLFIVLGVQYGKYKEKNNIKKFTIPIFVVFGMQ